jgi:hypothetical protein
MASRLDLFVPPDREHTPIWGTGHWALFINACTKTIDRMNKRGQLPPPMARINNRDKWSPAQVKAHVANGAIISVQERRKAVAALEAFVTKHATLEESDRATLRDLIAAVAALPAPAGTPQPSTSERRQP